MYIITKESEMLYNAYSEYSIHLFLFDVFNFNMQTS